MTLPHEKSVPNNPQATQTALFRPEVAEAKSGNWMGSIRLTHPISGTLVALGSLLIAGTFIVFAVVGTVTQKARVAGLVIPIEGALAISTQQSGTLLHAFAKEGEQVAAGQVLFELSTERQQNNGELSTLIAQQLAVRRETLQSERMARISLAREKQQAIDGRITNTETEANQLGSEIRLGLRRKSLAQQSVDKFETLHASGFVSQAQLQQKQEELIDTESRLSSLERSKTQLNSDLLNLRTQRKQLSEELETELAQFRRAEASLEQEVVQNQDRKRALIVAPQAGTVTALNFHVGQALTAGQSLATLVPGSPDGLGMEANLYAPSRTAGFVMPGQKVLIRYQAYPYQKFGLQGGEIINISKTPFSPSELPPNIAGTILGNVQHDGAGPNEALYRIRVKLDSQFVQVYGEAQQIKPGMTLEADILQDQRKIWEWIAEPLLALSSRKNT
ncbi:HlyD family efflux transporter periplasmic adaptor subunit [Pseudoduganella eburnea]|uniref:HlyD family efflux transporter periplasmic adaptor subunit n=1 Tax=Massilia eburnea TaxID=1776165 RepID=A0A6L6QJB9_9BURK|nr:HlyD family efflux transporter periplasmic adaptor subunit [Massilia eburnea]MTW12359.1 HlyD family efflux transporter periplasmic adaptor subunit [Massilia eburnea]